MKRSKLLVLFIVLVLIVSCNAPQQRPMEQRPKETNLSAIARTKPVEYCRITADNVTVRNGAGHTFDSIGTLERNDIVKVLGELDNWYVVQLENNQVGGIEAAKATPVIVEGEKDPTPPQAGPNQAGPNQAGTDKADVPLQNNQNPLLDPRRSPDAEDATEPNTIPTPPPDITGEPQLRADDIPNADNRNRATDAGGNLTNMATQMVELVNRERQQNGLSALAMDAEVARVAGIKSQDMVDNNYFSHNSPTYGSPFEMLDSFGIKYRHAGENLAGHQSVQSAHEALMNSAGHRQNILSNDFTHIGIGVRNSDRYGYVFTQMFISKPK